jgi:hypothetical protein
MKSKELKSSQLENSYRNYQPEYNRITLIRIDEEHLANLRGDGVMSKTRGENVKALAVSY